MIRCAKLCWSMKKVIQKKISWILIKISIIRICDYIKIYIAVTTITLCYIFCHGNLLYIYFKDNIPFLIQNMYKHILLISLYGLVGGYNINLTKEPDTLNNLHGKVKIPITERTNGWKLILTFTGPVSNLDVSFFCRWSREIIQLIYFHLLNDTRGLLGFLWSDIMLHLGLKVCTKLKVKVPVYFVTSMFSFILVLFQQNCSIKIKIDRLILMHLAFRK